jgi:hypothetical protein
MASDISHQARLTVAASFLPHFFLENLAIRHDNSILVTVATRKELWYLPPPRRDAQVDPMLLHTFDEFAPAEVWRVSPLTSYCSGRRAPPGVGFLANMAGLRISRQTADRRHPHRTRSSDPLRSCGLSSKLNSEPTVSRLGTVGR